jgi:hypothetical protein
MTYAEALQAMVERSARFWANVQRTDDVARFVKVDGKLIVTGACWPWLRSRFKSGYGKVWWQGKVRRAHRVALELTYGPIPSGINVCHWCDNPICCRPHHLFTARAALNMADKMRKGRGRSLKGAEHPNARKTHCPRGHPYDEANTYRHPVSGRRRCRACRNERNRQRRKHVVTSTTVQAQEEQTWKVANRMAEAGSTSRPVSGVG